MYARGSSVHQKCSNYGLTNLLFSFVQIHMNKLILLSLVLIPISKL
jgi:hypothetical protein